MRRVPAQSYGASPATWSQRQSVVIFLTESAFRPVYNKPFSAGKLTTLQQIPVIACNTLRIFYHDMMIK